MDTQNERVPRLCTGGLNTLPSTVQGINYARDACDVGIVHLGIGAFHRAHQAVYTDDALAKQGGDWKILGVSLRSPQVREQLSAQDGLYTLVEMDDSETRYRLIGSVDDVLVAPENPEAVLEALCASSCKIVSLTITEKGYCHDPATGRLNQQHPDIVHDLSQPQAPRTAIGFIVEALRRRWQDHGLAPTILCCDNLPDNGRTLQRLVGEFAAQVDPQLGDWICRHVPFPNTMVDRIVPATETEDIERLEDACGYHDLGMVKSERFSQWVIEDNFAAGRPCWDQVGATLVGDVEPFELAKLRLLNGTHSALAYLGFLAGYQYVHEVVADHDFVRFLRRLMIAEIAPTLIAPPGMDLVAYSERLLERFANSSLQHRTYQIAMDGSQKLPQRLLGTMRDRLAAEQKQSIDCLCLAIAGWIRYVMAFDEQGASIAVQDPLADRFQATEAKAYDATDNMHDINALIDGFLGVNEVFDTDLPAEDLFRSRLKYWLSHLLANGASSSVKILLTEQSNAV